MTSDSGHQYRQALSFTFNDAHPPIMAWLWAVVMTFKEGPASLFFVFSILYWLGFWLWSVYFSRGANKALWSVPIIIGYCPFVLMYSGVLWKDVLAATTFLCVGALVALRMKGLVSSRSTFILAFALLLMGGLARYNAALALFPMLAALLYPCVRFRDYRFKNIFVVVICGALSLLIAQALLTKVTQPARVAVANYLFLFDLTGISKFSKVNYLPGSWTADESKMIIDSCYQPYRVNNLVWGECKFVFAKIYEEKNLEKGLLKDWILAIKNNPMAYLQHRIAHVLELYSYYNSPYVWKIQDVSSQFGFKPNGLYKTIGRLVDIIGTTPVLKYILTIGFWSTVAVVGSIIASVASFRKNRDVQLEQILFYSAALYVLPLIFIGVADDFRYCYWTMIASLLGLVSFWMRRQDSVHNKSVKSKCVWYRVLT